MKDTSNRNSKFKTSPVKFAKQLFHWGDSHGHSDCHCHSDRGGFTLIELLIVIGIIAILAAAVIIAINPGKQFAQARDATRESHINSIKNSILSYQVDNIGSISDLDITTTPQEICQTGAIECTGLADLSGLSDYISEMPVDPQGGVDANGTGYYIFKLSGEVAIQASKAETGITRTGRWSFIDSRDDQSYKTTLIGDQLWIAENLKYLPEVHSNTEFETKGNNDGPGYGVYGYDGSDVEIAKEEDNYKTYGVLYNWHAVDQVDICPDGWHVPTGAEWTDLETWFFNNGYSGVEGEDLKDPDAGWCYSDTCGGTGFLALPSGYRITSGLFGYIDSLGLWWLSTEDGVDAYRRRLSNSYPGINNLSLDQDYGISVRCLRD